MASPPQKLTKVFDLIDKYPLQRSTSAILCMADQLGAFDKDNLIVPHLSHLNKETCRNIRSWNWKIHRNKNYPGPSAMQAGGPG